MILVFHKTRCLVAIAVMFFCFFSYTEVQAATDSFTVQTLVGGDVNPPSVPAGLTAIPVALSQINLAWNASTDDSGTVSGYHIWRDSVLIATTSAITYADSGLSSSTLYSYYVTAFDPSFNESASSTVVATTTFSFIPPSIAPQGSQYGSRIIPFDEILRTLEVLPQKDSVSIRYETEIYTQSVIQWGKGSSYELGSLAEQIFMTRHVTSITNLLPGTTYTFMIRGEDRFGRQGVLYTGTFTTLPPDDIFPPLNVTGLTAERVGSEVFLSWINPRDADFEKVRVMRNDRFYPSDTADGWVVYEGDGEDVWDDSVVTGDRVFYTVFSYDSLGNVSSGAVVGISFNGDSATRTPIELDPTKNEIKLSFNTILFTQEGIILHPAEDGTVRIDGSKQLTVSIPYELMPQHLKTILVTVKDSRNIDRTLSFLLRANREKTEYLGTLAPFGVGGDFPIEVSVFDYTTAQIGYVYGILTSSIKPIHTDSDPDVAVGFLSYLTTIGRSYILWFIALLILLMFVSRRLMHAKF